MVFEKAEFRERLHKTKVEMQKREIDILISTNPANMNYLSGYDGYSFYVIQGVMVLINEPEPIWIGRNMDVPGAAFSSWLSTENIIGYGDDYVQSNTKHPMHFFADVLIEKGVSNKRIGLELGQDSLSVTSFMELQKKLPDCQFKDASFLVNHVRMIKSDTEIHYMKLAGEITVNAMITAFDSIQEGVIESDVASGIYQSLIKGKEDQHGDYPAIIPLMSSGQKIAAPHLSWTNNAYKKEDIVTLELSGCVHRYHAPLARTAYIGTPTQKYLDIVNIVLEGLYEMLQVIKAGITCDEIARIWNKVIAKSTITKDSRVGYPIGIGYPPDWGEQTFSIRPGDSSILQNNMTFHILPALFQADTGFVVSESIRVTEKGCELLTNLSQNLVQK
nr:M24 family metallopeptidase [Neobacillus sp. Marseille-Q6967]